MMSAVIRCVIGFGMCWLAGDARAEPLEMGRAALQDAIRQAPAAPAVNVAKSFEPDLGRDAYRLERTPDGGFRITGADATGAMYGSMDVAEAIRLGRIAVLRSGVHAPAIAWRGLLVDAHWLEKPDEQMTARVQRGARPGLLREMARQRFNLLVISRTPSSPRAATPALLDRLRRDAGAWGVTVESIEVGSGDLLSRSAGSPWSSLPVRRALTGHSDGTGAGLWLEIADDVPPDFRGGDPDDVREVVTRLRGHVAGLVLGCEFLPANEGAEDPASYRRILWGRLAYDPALPDTEFEAIVGHDYPHVPAHRVFRALQAAAHSLSLLRRYFAAGVPWTPETGFRQNGRSSQYCSVDHLISGEIEPDAGLESVPRWRSDLLSAQPMAGLAPEMVADIVQGNAAETITVADSLRRFSEGSPDLQPVIADTMSLGWLARFYAAKLRGATSLALYDATGDPDAHAAAVRYLTNAQAFWNEFVRGTVARHGPRLRSGTADVTATTALVGAEVEAAKEWRVHGWSQ